MPWYTCINVCNKGMHIFTMLFICFHAWIFMLVIFFVCVLFSYHSMSLGSLSMHVIGLKRAFSCCFNGFPLNNLFCSFQTKNKQNKISSKPRIGNKTWNKRKALTKRSKTNFDLRKFYASLMYVWTVILPSHSFTYFRWKWHKDMQSK